MRNRSDLFPHQLRAIERMVALRRCAVFLPMGLGKTACTLTALVDLEMPRTLIVAPARVVETDVWGKEAAAWEHLRHIEVVPLLGPPGVRRKLLAHPAPVEVISYELFPWLVEEVDIEARYGAVVFDELSKMKTPGSVRFKRMRSRSMAIPIRFGLTGTPVGNHLVDVWGEMFAVAGDAPLGPSKALFLARYFDAIPIGNTGAKTYRLIPGADELIHERVRPHAFSLAPAEAPRFELRENPIHVPLPREAERLSDELARDLRVELASGKELVALSAGARAAKVRQLAGGAVYLEDGTWEETNTAKLEALEEIVDGLQGEPVLVAYWYRHERDRILRRFPKAVQFTAADADRWNRREIGMMVVHPASIGHGINLQHGGHNLVWFTVPWSWELLSQTNGRLARTGQPSPFVLAHYLLAGETDRYVLDRVREKARAEAALVGAVAIR